MIPSPPQERDAPPPPTARQEQRLPFLAGLVAFAAVAALGWNNLHYGLGFHDEGMYMADAWRMAQGDRLFPDNAPSVLRLYVVFNAAVFQAFPDITLLGFRRLQLVLTLLACGFLGAAAYRWTGRYAHLPWVLSLFAFTGLQVRGTAPNLSYHTYPHLFFTLYFACFLFALKSPGGRARAAWLSGAGLCLWAAGFSFLPLSAGAVAPVLYWALARWLRVEGPPFTLRDLLLVLAPVGVLWGGFLAFYNTAFLHSLVAMAGYMGETKARGIQLDPAAWPYVGVGALFLLAAVGAARLPARIAVPALGAASAAMLWVVGTNAGDLVPPYASGLFSRPMWLAGVLIALLLVFHAGAVAERLRAGRCRLHAGLPFVILSQLAVPAILASQFSDSRLLAVTFLAIPGAVALAAYLLDRLPAAGARPVAAAAHVAAFLLPFYVWAAWADWRFTYFDLPPERLTVTIPDGFAAGVATNPMFATMADWISATAQAYSGPGDRAIVLERAPMGYLLARRRPALNHSWTGLGESQGLRADAVAEMEARGIAPRIAYRFVHPPLLFPVPGQLDRYLPGPRIPYGPDDPVSSYIQRHMGLLDRFTVNGEPWIELYVAPSGQADPGSR